MTVNLKHTALIGATFYLGMYVLSIMMILPVHEVHSVHYVDKSEAEVMLQHRPTLLDFILVTIPVLEIGRV